MPIDNRAGLDISRFLQNQRHERFHAFVIHGKPFSGKTRFALKLAELLPGVAYLDLLTHVVADPQLSEQIDLFTPADLKKLILAHARDTSASVLLVDEIDFLIPIWGDLSGFQRLVAKLSQAETPAVIGFILQTTSPLEGWSLTSQNTGQSRILRLGDIQDVKPISP